MKHEKYWRKRNDEILKWLDKQEISVYKRLEDAYSQGLLDVRKDLLNFFDNYAQDNHMTKSEAMKKLTNEELRTYRDNARRYREYAMELEPKQRKELLDRLNAQYQASKFRRLDELEQDLIYELGKLNGQLQKEMEKHLLKVGDHTYRHAAPNSGAFTVQVLNQPALLELINRPLQGHNYSADLWQNTDALAEDLKKVFRKGFERGSSVQQMSSDLKKRFRVKQSHAENLIRTDGSHIVNNATAKRYMDAGLRTYKVHVHMDERTSDICQEIHKKDEVYLFSEYEPGVTAPPFHYSCRTTIVPDMEELLQVA